MPYNNNNNNNNTPRLHPASALRLRLVIRVSNVYCIGGRHKKRKGERGGREGREGEERGGRGGEGEREGARRKFTQPN